ncbi:hypothetical protein IKR55_00325 [bacterium]|nr:hypothetical protein [Elusimicrobiota bacterium]MBR6301161.1 hypothetical protein [bacterium]
MVIQKDLKEILEVIVLTANVFGLFISFQNWFFDYKFNQKMSELKAKKTNKNRCTFRRGKQR